MYSVGVAADAGGVYTIEEADVERERAVPARQHRYIIIDISRVRATMGQVASSPQDEYKKPKEFE